MAYKSLHEIQIRKAELLKSIRHDQKEMGKLWNEVAHPEKSPRSKGVSLASVLSTSVGVLDGALFAWKLYRRLKK